MKKFILLAMVVMLGAAGCTQGQDRFTVIDAEQFEQQVDKEDIQLVDVRTAKEFEEGHIAGAQNIDFFAEDFLDQFKGLDKEKPLYIYCRSGNRSAKASRKLSEAGFKNIIDLEGGYIAWKAAGKK